jgi:hypothetical protein
MAEEQVAELYAMITADLEEFRLNLDEVETRLDGLIEHEVKLDMQTDATDSGFGMLAGSLEGFGSVLDTVYDRLKQNSGALQGFSDYIWGLVGAGIDTLFVKLLEIWENMGITGEDVMAVFSGVSDTFADLADMLGLSKDKGDETKEAIDGVSTSLEGTGKQADNARTYMDEYGNTLKIVGDQIYYYNDATGELTSMIDLLDGSMEDAWINTSALVDITQEVADALGLEWSSLFAMISGEASALNDELTGDRLTDILLVKDYADAADEVWRRVAANLVNLGIDPTTGDEITRETYTSAQKAAGVYGPLSTTQLVDYLLRGQ